MTRIRTPRSVAIALVAIVIVGAVVRLWNLGGAALNFDESFTAMVGRLSPSRAFAFLRAHDSHPPLSYLLQLPLARARVSPFVFRLPAVSCSIAALALFAWWMRDRGRVGIAATAAMAISSFQIAYAREARMYGLLELIGVVTAIVAESWLREPRRRHAAGIAALTLVGMMTHVSMALLAIGLLALAGRRRDKDAWRWRAAIGLGVAGWAALWGRSFLVQARGGHSSWIPHTTPARFAQQVGGLVVGRPEISMFVIAAIAAGGIVCWRRDRTLATVFICCFVVPATLAGIIGLRAPVLQSRTLTVAAWGPLLALGYLIDALLRRSRALGTVAVALAVVAGLAAIPNVLRVGGATVPLTKLESVTRSGDVIAVQPPSKGIELYWTLGVRSDDGPARAIRLGGLGDAVALALTGHRPTGRIWLMQYKGQQLDLRHVHLCAPIWRRGPSRMVCIRRAFGPTFTHTSVPSIAP